MKIPLMPKGVEHAQTASLRCLASMVKIPLMPKGVEHILYLTFGFIPFSP